MIHDREVDPAFAAHLRDLRIFFAPALSSYPRSRRWSSKIP